MSFKSVIGWVGTVVMYIVYIAIMLTYPVGIYHMYKKHTTKDLIVGAIAFPWAMYRGVEMFWHKDDDGIDWDKRLSSDLRSSIYLLTEGAYKNSDVYKINESIEGFSDKIKEYPKDKKQYLLDGAKEYVKYTLSVTKDAGETVVKFFENGVYTLEYSDSTIKYRTTLISKYKLSDIIDELEKIMNEQSKKVSANPVTDKQEIEKMTETFKIKQEEIMTKAKTDISRIYQMIFNEPYQ